MSGHLIPFRKGEARTARGRPASPGSDPRRVVGGDPAGTAAPTPRPFEASRFRNLIVPHMDAAYSLARYLARDPVAAEDIAQEALMKAFHNIDALRGEVRPWLLTIVRNSYFDWRRREDGRTVTGPAAEAAFAETPDDRQESPEASLIRRGDVAALRAAIELIPEPFREALVLRDLEELSYREVSEVTGVPLGTVMSRLSRARRMLGERMGVMEAVA
jgi:RNA polymerase sigma-70 factor (ECF subfamily)